MHLNSIAELQRGIAQPEPTHWGTRLRLLLRRHGMSQSELAEQMHVSPMTVTKWARGGGVSNDNLERLCGILKATRSWLRWGEDFFDDSVWTDTPAGDNLIRTYANGTHQLSLATVTEATHGFVIWMLDSEAGSWSWSGNAHRFFGLLDASKSNAPIHEQIRNAMWEEDVPVARQLLSEMMSGERPTAWMRFSLRGKPRRSYFSIVRNVPSAAGRWKVHGLTIASGSLMGNFFGYWSGPASSLDAPTLISGGYGS